MDLDDDAVHVNMGGKWRMPTEEQLNELYNNTTHKAKTINGVKGMMFTSNINGRQLFIPFAGYWYNGSFAAAGSYALVWSSRVHPSYVNNAYGIYCHLSGNAIISYYTRSYAFSVRGVFKK